MTTEYVWIFNGAKGRFPGGVFSRIEIAEQWIRSNKLSGVLTRYPLDIGSFNWANDNGFVSDKLRARADSDLIGSFSSASFEHYHYEHGHSGGRENNAARESND